VPTTTRTDPAAVRARNEARCQRLLDRSELLQVEDLDWDAVGTIEVPEATLRTLVYMRDVEGFTGSYLVGVGAHRTTLADPLIAAFFEVWKAEELAHAAALDRWLRRYSEVRGVEVPAPQPAPDRAVRPVERVLARTGGAVGELAAAAHMAWGAANELLTLNGYRRLAERSPDPVLATVLERIAAQESRHYSFYLLQAEWRLASSRLARWLLPRVLDGSWTPVGIGDGYKSREEFERVLAYLAGGDEGTRVIQRMDRRFAALPGFGHLQIFRDAVGGVVQLA
jgi:rubrerythrin